MLCSVSFALTLSAVLLIMFFAFLAARVDGKVGWPLRSVFAPIWIADFLIVYLTIVRLRGAINADPSDEQFNIFGEEDEENENEENDDDEDGDEDGEGDTADITGHNRRSRRRRTPNATGEDAKDERFQALREQRKKQVVVAQIIGLVYVLLLVLFQVFIVLREDGTTNWSAGVVFIPLLIVEGVNFLQSIVSSLTHAAASLQRAALAFSTQGDRDQPQVITPAMRIRIIIQSFASEMSGVVLRIVLWILIILKCDGTFDESVSWNVVFIPLYLYAVKSLVPLVHLYTVSKQLDSAGADEETKKQTKSALVGATVLISIWLVLYLAFVALLAKKLDLPDSTRLAVALIPLFIVLSLACCCMCMVTCALASGVGAMASMHPDGPENADEDPDAAAANNGGNGSPNGRNGRKPIALITHE
ncbi:hypothetical protein GQ42DRAFT_9929, partial [Ramicandelaber brevisporus]